MSYQDRRVHYASQPAQDKKMAIVQKQEKTIYHKKDDNCQKQEKKRKF